MPVACDIPTGLGKTSIMAIWLAALDLSAAHPLPRRLVYVVDRRAVVDQATDEARMLADALGDGSGEDIDPAIAGIRRRLRLERGQRLPVSTLRGQLTDTGAWLDDPASAAIVVGTVDMIGSRLLFQGYDVSPRMRPVHAALLGTDAIIVLDEAHLVPPFEALVRQAIELGAKDRGGSPIPFPELKMMTLSATGRETKGAVFTLQVEDWEDERVRQRLDAPKRLTLEDVPGSADMAEIMGDRAWQRSAGGRRVAIFTDSRRLAQQVHDRLEKRLKDHLKERFGKAASKAEHYLSLMVGARRVREREKLAESEAFQRFSPATAEAAAGKSEGMPAFLVATSAGEVGVDIDADHAVCDLVAWERMVQRLGRVNRLGKFTEGSLVDVLVATPEKDAEAPADSEEMKRWRAPFESPVWHVEQNGRRNASPGALRRLREDVEFRRRSQDASTGEPLRPALTRPLLDAWSMTSAVRHTGRPEVAPWIRGWTEDEPQTRVLWRSVLPIRFGEPVAAATKAMNDWLDVAPPHLGEVLETYTSSVVELLRKRARALAKGQDDDAADNESVDAEPEAAPTPSDEDAQEEAAANDTLQPSAVVCVVLTADRKVDHLLTFRDLEAGNPRRLAALLAGRTVILDARIGGLAESGLLEANADAPPATLDGEFIAGPEAAGTERLWDDNRLEAIGFRVRRVRHRETPVANWNTAYRRFVDARAEEEGMEDALEWRVEAYVGNRPARSDPAMTKVDQELARHHADCQRSAERISDRLHLPAPLRRVLAEAAGMHDSGKARRNWQAFAGNPRWTGDPAKALAKFSRGGGPALLKIGEEVYRHEFGSLHDAVSQPALVNDVGEEWRDLFLHVLAAHHGKARPVIAAVDEKYPPTLCATVAREAALRFVRLQKRFGPWGLAWIETLLRAADVAASRAPSTSADEAGASSTKGEAA